MVTGRLTQSPKKPIEVFFAASVGFGLCQNLSMECPCTCRETMETWKKLWI